MGSEEAWCFTQRLAGIILAALGLVLTIVMLVASAGYANKAVNEIISSGLTSLLWEIGLSGIACLAISVTAMVRYDRKGRRRNEY
jgi:uncharacterized membrane protein YedE/YeeE